MTFKMIIVYFPDLREIIVDSTGVTYNGEHTNCRWRDVSQDDPEKTDGATIDADGRKIYFNEELEDEIMGNIFIFNVIWKCLHMIQSGEVQRDSILRIPEESLPSSGMEIIMMDCNEFIKKYIS